MYTNHIWFWVANHRGKFLPHRNATHVACWLCQMQTLLQQKSLCIIVENRVGKIINAKHQCPDNYIKTNLSFGGLPDIPNENIRHLQFHLPSVDLSSLNTETTLLAHVGTKTVTGFGCSTLKGPRATFVSTGQVVGCIWIIQSFFDLYNIFGEFYYWLHTLLGPWWFLLQHKTKTHRFLANSFVYVL